MARGSKKNFISKNYLALWLSDIGNNVCVDVRTPLVCLKKVEQSSSAAYAVIAQMQTELHKLREENFVMKEQMNELKNGFLSMYSMQREVLKSVNFLSNAQRNMKHSLSPEDSESQKRLKCTTNNELVVYGDGSECEDKSVEESFEVNIFSQETLPEESGENVKLMLNDWSAVSDKLAKVPLEDYIYNYLDQRTEKVYEKLMDDGTKSQSIRKAKERFTKIYTTLMLGKPTKDEELEQKPSSPNKIIHWKERTQKMSKEYYKVAKEINEKCGATGKMTRTSLIKTFTKMKQYMSEDTC